MSIPRLALFTFLIIGFFNWGTAQSTGVCYEKFVKEGLAAQNQLDFDLAIYKFEAAEVCWDKPLENNLEDLLKIANEAKIKAITDARDRAKKSEAEVLEQLKLSEGSRFAFLANREREKGNSGTALKLAFHAMKLTGEKTTVAIKRAFGDAVYRATLQEWKGHRQSIRSANFSPDGQLLLTCSNDSSVIVWKNNGEKLTHLRKFNAAVQSAKFSPDGKKLLIASEVEASLWNLQGEKLTSFKGHSDLIYEVDFSPDGQKVATCSRDQSVRIWEAQTGNQLAICQGPKAAQTQVRFAPDGNSLLSLSGDKSIYIWTLQGTAQKVLKYRDLYFGGAAFGPQGQQLTTYTVDQNLQIWDLQTEQVIHTLKGHQRMIHQLTIAPNMAGLLSASSDPVAIFWKASGEFGFRLDDHSASVEAVRFSEDGQYLLTASKDKSAKFYRNNGQLLMDLSAFPGPIADIAISPNNQLLVIVGESPVVYLCQTPEAYFSYLQAHPPAEFTPEEKEKYTILE